MLLGAHVSVAGGLHKAFSWTSKYRCECLQIFTKSQLRWMATPLQAGEIRLWTEAWTASGQPPCVIHDSYLINLASPEDELRERSVNALVDELERAHALGIAYVNTHPGSHKGAGAERGLKACARSLSEVLERTARLKSSLLLETTAGQGNDLGSMFEQLAYLIEHAKGGERLGVCFDTCHAFAAGYDFTTGENYDKLWSTFDRLLGIERVKAFHLNDSKFPCGSHRDRHAEIGQGHIGEAGFRRLVRDPRFQDIPGITELPDAITLPSLDTLRRLRDGSLKQWQA